MHYLMQEDKEDLKLLNEEEGEGEIDLEPMESYWLRLSRPIKTFASCFGSPRVILKALRRMLEKAAKKSLKKLKLLIIPKTKKTKKGKEIKVPTPTAADYYKQEPLD